MAGDELPIHDFLYGTACTEDRTVAFTPDKFPQLHLSHPKLWWPWQMGEAHLERLIGAEKGRMGI